MQSSGLDSSVEIIQLPDYLTWSCLVSVIPGRHPVLHLRGLHHHHVWGLQLTPMSRHSSMIISLCTPASTVHPSLDILQVVIQYHVKLESGDWVCVLGYLWDLCARFIGKSFTGAGSGSGLSSGERGRGRERAEAQPAAGEWGEATQARERGRAAPALAWPAVGQVIAENWAWL